MVNATQLANGGKRTRTQVISASEAIVPLFRKETPSYSYDHTGFGGGQVIQSLAGYVRGVGLYTKSPEKSLKDFK